MSKLPKRVKIDLWKLLDSYQQDELNELIADYLSDTYGYCFRSCCTEVSVNVTEIEWDTER